MKAEGGFRETQQPSEEKPIGTRGVVAIRPWKRRDPMALAEIILEGKKQN